MSYILEALKKSEQERRIGAVPDLSMAQEPSSHAAPRWPRWLLGALLLNAAILVFVAWRVWDAKQLAESSGGQASGVAPAAVPAAPAGAGTADVPPEIPQPATVPAVTSLPSALPEPVSEQPAAAPVLNDATQMPGYEYDASPEKSDSDLRPDPQQADRADAIARWEDLPSPQRADLPVPRIDVHVFASEPERRFVLIDLRKYSQGDTLDNGAVIETILADGIVLSYRGQQYRVDRP